MSDEPNSLCSVPIFIVFVYRELNRKNHEFFNEVVILCLALLPKYYSKTKNIFMLTVLLLNLASSKPIKHKNKQQQQQNPSDNPAGSEQRAHSGPNNLF